MEEGCALVSWSNSPKACRAKRRTAIFDQRVESCRLRTDEVEASLLKLVRASVEQISAFETENVRDALNELSGGERSALSSTGSSVVYPIDAAAFEKETGSRRHPGARCALPIGHHVGQHGRRTVKK